MSINFTGINNPQLFICRKGVPLKLANIAPDEKINTIRIKCNVTDDKTGNDLAELKRITSKSPQMFKEFLDFNENDTLQIDITPSEYPANSKFCISFNGILSDTTDRSILGICTFLCMLTKKLLNNYELVNNGGKYLIAANKVSDKIAKKFLKNL